MVITPDPNAEGRVYTLVDVRDVEYATEILLNFGIDGGRFVGGKLEIADNSGKLGGRLQLLAETFGLELDVTPARIEFISREEHHNETD